MTHLSEPMNVIRVTEGEAVWWHVTRGNMAGEFVTIADYIPDEGTARLIAAGPKLLASLITCANLLAVYDEADGPEGDAYREAVIAISDATGGAA